MKPITTSLWSFPDLIDANCVYVDKTDLLLKLIRSVDRSFFIARPRRFGKSLMLSTLQCIFEGRRELFEGLKIAQTDYDWKTYPVLKIDMSWARGMSSQSTQLGLNTIVKTLAKDLSLDVDLVDDPGVSFLNLWAAIRERNLQVVVLIDEYDVPLQGFLNKPDEFEQVRQLLHDFYMHLKANADCIRFLMLTGVTKITKLSIFSGLNSPTDITMRADYASLLGYTHEEFERHFAEHIDAFAAAERCSHAEMFGRFLGWYDNYRFSPRSEAKVLNPVSVGYALTEQVFRSYWIETGQSSMVVERLRKAGKIPPNLEGVVADEDQLSALDSHEKSGVALLYQAGYLTIKRVLGEGLLMLGVPNHEVRASLSKYFLGSLTNDDTVTAEFLDKQRRAALALEKGDLAAAIDFFRTAVAETPYSWLTRDEGAAKVGFAMFFYPLRNVRVSTEREMASGRIDAVYEGQDAVYIFEFKYDKSAQEAFDQIVEKGYAKPYLGTGRKIWGIGLNFNPNAENRGVDEPVVREILRME